MANPRNIMCSCFFHVLQLVINFKVDVFWSCENKYHLGLTVQTAHTVGWLLILLRDRLGTSEKTKWIHIFLSTLLLSSTPAGAKAPWSHEPQTVPSQVQGGTGEWGDPLRVWRGLAPERPWRLLQTSPHEITQSDIRSALCPMHSSRRGSVCQSEMTGTVSSPSASWYDVIGCGSLFVDLCNNASYSRVRTATGPDSYV